MVKEEYYILQKNARCPICAGTLRYREGGQDILIFCINCGSKMKVVDFGQTEGEFKVVTT